MVSNSFIWLRIKVTSLWIVPNALSMVLVSCAASSSNLRSCESTRSNAASMVAPAWLIVWLPDTRIFSIELIVFCPFFTMESRSGIRSWDELIIVCADCVM